MVDMSKPMQVSLVQFIFNWYYLGTRFLFSPSQVNLNGLICDEDS
uniref:Uncharacterized protein n=1 Tax=Rhizophora mucronata TaxID=61149 RepID=A0A2P2P278_RHIMU